MSMRVVQTAALFGAWRAGVVKSAVIDEASSRRRHEYTCSLNNEALDEPIACGDSRALFRWPFWLWPYSSARREHRR